MIYVTSDLHGYSLEKFQQLLQKAAFSEDDFCFILGDVIDRGTESVRLLQWLMVQPNVELLLGNHEAMLLSNLFLFDEITETSVQQLDEDQMERLSDWLENGGDTTLAQFKQCSAETVRDIVEYLQDLSVYETLTVNGRAFFLSHSGPDHFEAGKPLAEYALDDFLWNRPTLTDTYFTDRISVFGHTPSGIFGPEYRGKILKTPHWIDVDTGVTAGYAPALLRLDDLQEFYLESV